MPEEEQITLSPACPFSSNLPHCTHALRARLSPIFLSRRWHCSSSKRFNASTPSVQHKRASETCTGQSLQTFAVNLAAVGINLILSIRVVVDTVESRHSRKAAGVTRARGHDDGRGKARRLHFGTGSWRGCFCSVQDWTQERSARCAGAGSVVQVWCCVSQRQNVAESSFWAMMTSCPLCSNPCAGGGQVAHA